MLSFLSLFFLPCFGIAVIAFTPSKNGLFIKKAALFFSILTFYSSLFLWILFDKSSIFFQHLFYRDWLSFLNINIILGLDGISLFFIILTTFLIPVCVLAGWKTVSYNIKEFFMLFLFLEVFLLLIFSVLDLLLFYVFFESVLIPMVRRQFLF